MTPTEQPITPPEPTPLRSTLEIMFEDGLDRFAAHTHAINQSKGFTLNPPTTEGQIAAIMLVVTELAEAVEGLRKDLPDDKLPHRKMVEVELADSLIRILNIGQWCGYDIAGAAIEKSRFNAGRPFRHGGKSL